MMVALLLMVVLVSPFVGARAELVPETSQVELGVTLDRGADVVVAHVIYAQNRSEIVALAPLAGEWRGAFELLSGGVPHVRFEAIFPGGESAVSETISLVDLGVDRETLVPPAVGVPPLGVVDSSSPLPAIAAVLSGGAVLFMVIGLWRWRRTT